MALALTLGSGAAPPSSLTREVRSNEQSCQAALGGEDLSRWPMRDAYLLCGHYLLFSGILMATSEIPKR